VKPNGRPVLVESGDTVQVIGPGGFPAKVKLTVEHPPAGNITTVRTKPGSAITAWFSVYDPLDGHPHSMPPSRGTVGGDGVYTVEWGPAIPVGTRELHVTIEEPGGNLLSRSMTIPPAI
jgi:hypothetical protein